MRLSSRTKSEKIKEFNLEKFIEIKLVPKKNLYLLARIKVYQWEKGENVIDNGASSAWGWHLSLEY